jgi:hypothetical protein
VTERAGVVLSLARATPARAWTQLLGPVTIVADRYLFGHLFQREIVTAEGKRVAVDINLVFEAENLVPFPPTRRGEQPSLFSA